MKMGKNSNAVGHIKPDRVICLFGRSPPVCRVRYTSGSPPHFSPQRNQWLSLRRSRSPCRGRLRHLGWYSILFTKSATVSNLGLLLHFSISMIVRTLMWSRSANAFCVKCCRFCSVRSFHANKSSGLFTAHHLYFILWCATAHLNNHIDHVIWCLTHILKVKEDIDENSRDKEVKIRRGSPLMCQSSPPSRKIFK